MEKPWGKYRAERRRDHTKEYYPESMYFADADWVTAITDPTESTFITCYHEHFDQGHQNPADMGTAGMRWLKYLEYFKAEKSNGDIRNVKWL